MIWLIFAHFIGDWGLQNHWMAENKGKYWFVMFAHCMVWTACICIALEYIGLFAWWHIGFLVTGHWICDVWKCSVYSKKPLCQQSSLWHLYLDQVIHLFQLGIVYLIQ